MIKLFKYLVLIVSLLFCYKGNLIAANYYFDLVSGNDVTGDGSTGNPWKTIDKCTTGRSSGDECRGAKTTITTLTGTLTFTNGSTSVATSADLTGVVAANDLVGKNTTDEGWWIVSSVSPTSITLVSQYYSKTGSGTAVTGYKITPVAASEVYEVKSSGSSSGRIKVTGGWDLSTETRDGYTCFKNYSATSDGFTTNNSDYLEISHFIIHNIGYRGFYANGTTDSYIHDVYVAGGSAAYGSFSINGLYYSDLEDTIVTGGSGNGYTITYVYSSSFTNIISYSSSSSASYSGIAVDGPLSDVKFNNVYVYNAYGNGVSFSASAELTSAQFLGGYYEGGRGGTARGIYFTSSSKGYSDVRLYNVTVAKVAGSSAPSDIYFASNFKPPQSVVVNLTGTISYDTSIYADHRFPRIVPSSGDSYEASILGTIYHDSAGSRSGKCIKISPTASTTRAIVESVGTVKITNTLSSITLKAYIKDDASYNGRVHFSVRRNGLELSREEKTPTTSYVQESIVVDSADLVSGEYLELLVHVSGTAGSVWIDDFSAEQ